MDKPLTKKQKDFLKVLKAKTCNVSAACEAFGISRETHYEWLTNPTYKKEYESIQESLIDFAESQLLKNIQSGKETSLIFFLKCRAKHRGYREKEIPSIQVNENPSTDLSCLSEDDLMRLAEVQMKLERQLPRVVVQLD